MSRAGCELRAYQLRPWIPLCESADFTHKVQWSPGQMALCRFSWAYRRCYRCRCVPQCCCAQGCCPFLFAGRRGLPEHRHLWSGGAKWPCGGCELLPGDCWCDLGNAPVGCSGWQSQGRGRCQQHLAWRSIYLKKVRSRWAVSPHPSPCTSALSLQRVIKLLCHCQWTMAPTHISWNVVHRPWLSLSSSLTLKSMNVLQKHRCYPESSQVVELPHIYNAFSFTLIFPWRMQCLLTSLSGQKVPF